jgi:menaquinol-cytochrome c reductase iron-sulfur subunit
MADPLPRPASPGVKPPTKPPAAAAPQRRSFLVLAASFVIGAVVGLVPLASGLAAFFDPLRRKAAAAKFIPVTTLEAIPDDGIPRQFPVIAERVDAWNRSLEPIGAVYLRRAPGAELPECFTATCPHAGCFVNYDSQSNTFKCPCHNSAFEVDGQIIPPSPSPRSLDTLECEVKDQAVLVKFENFYTGKSDKVIKG